LSVSNVLSGLICLGSVLWIPEYEQCVPKNRASE